MNGVTLPSARRRHPIVLTLAILNIVFGSMGALCCGGQQLMQPLMGAVIRPLMATVQTQQKAEQAEQERQFAEAITAAETEEEKAEIERDRAEYRARNPEFDFDKMFAIYDDRRFVVFCLVDGITCIIANVVLVISGVGLLVEARWARQTALIIAVVKIVLALAVAAYTAAVIAPLQAEVTEDMMQQMQKSMAAQGGVAPPFMPIGQLQRTFGAIGAFFNAAFVSIYPVVLLVLLNLSQIRRVFARSPESASP